MTSKIPVGVLCTRNGMNYLTISVDDYRKKMSDLMDNNHLNLVVCLIKYFGKVFSQNHKAYATAFIDYAQSKSNVEFLPTLTGPVLKTPIVLTVQKSPEEKIVVSFIVPHPKIDYSVPFVGNNCDCDDHL